jgi:transcriptional regulator NrdR family protein
MHALCPNCRETEGDVIDRKRGNAGGLRVRLECPVCDHGWVIDV